MDRQAQSRRHHIERVDLDAEKLEQVGAGPDAIGAGVTEEALHRFGPEWWRGRVY
jgi:hypothetical protein